MNDSYYALEVMMRQRQRDVLRDADLRRLARAGTRARRRVPRPQVAARSLAPVLAPILARVGRLLVAAGEKLETRAARASARGGNRACVDCLPVGPAT